MLIWMRGTERTAQHFHHAVDEPWRLDRLRPQLLAARKGQHALGQRRAALRALRWRRRSGARSRGSSGTRFRSSSRLPSTAISRLLKSCATPPVSWPEALHLLHLVHLRQRRLALAGALLDALLQFGIGPRQLGGALRDAALQLGIQQLRAGASCGTVRRTPAPWRAAVPAPPAPARNRPRPPRSRAAGRGRSSGSPETKMIAVRWKRGCSRIICRQFEAVELRHADVDQHDGDVVAQQLLAAPRCAESRLDQVLAELAAGSPRSSAASPAGRRPAGY